MVPTCISLQLRQSRGALTWVAWVWLASAYGVANLVTLVTFMAFYLKSSHGGPVHNSRRKVELYAPRPPSGRWRVVSMPLAGALGLVTFGVIAIPLSYLIQAMWSPRIDTMYVALTGSALLWFLVVGVVSVLYAFLMLNARSYKLWWYRMYFAIGIPPVAFAILYAIACFFIALNIRSLLSTAIFFSYVLLFATLASIMLGSVGTLSAYVYCYFAHRSIIPKED